MDKDCIIIFLILILIIALLNKRNDNKYIKDFKKYYKGVTKNFNRESFNTFADTRYVSNLPSPDSSYSGKMNNIPYKLIALSHIGSNKIFVNTINGIQLGDKIKINPNEKNYEEKIVVGLGNGILVLNSRLRRKHLPNEPIININNQELNYGNINNQNIKMSRYGFINNQGRINFTPEEETWSLSRNSTPSEEGIPNGIENNKLFFIS